MKTLKTLTVMLAIPLTLAGCNGLESDYRDNQARDWTRWEARDMHPALNANPAKCDGWNYNIGRNVWPEGEPDFGCASASNLAKMVANPNDLLEGRSTANADAARSDLFIQNYREGKVKELMKDEKVLNTQ